MVTWNDGGDVVVTGSDALTKPSGSQYSVSGGNGPYTWSVSGTGATITQEGYLELSALACGGFSVTCTDCTGRSSSVVGRVTNAGSWGDVVVDCTNNPGYWVTIYTCYLISGAVRSYTDWGHCGSSDYNHYPYIVPCGYSWIEDPTLYPCTAVCASDTGFAPGDDPCYDTYDHCRKIIGTAHENWVC